MGGQGPTCPKSLNNRRGKSEVEEKPSSVHKKVSRGKGKNAPMHHTKNKDLRENCGHRGTKD